MSTQPSKMADNIAMLSELLSQFVMAGRSKIAREDFTEICAQLGMSQLERANLDSLFTSACNMSGASSARGARNSEAAISVLLALLNECAAGKRGQPESVASSRNQPTSAPVPAHATPPAPAPPPPPPAPAPAPATPTGKLGMLLNELANATLFTQWRVGEDIDVRALREYMRHLAGEEMLSVPPLSRLPTSSSTINVKVLSQITMQHLITNVPRSCVAALVVLLDELRQCQLQIITQSAKLQKFAENEQVTNESKDAKILQLEETMREMKRKEVGFVDEIVRMKSNRQELEKEAKQLKAKVAELEAAAARSSVSRSESRKSAKDDLVILPHLIGTGGDREYQRTESTTSNPSPNNLANQTKKLLGELDAVRMKIAQINRQKSDASTKHGHYMSDIVLDRQRFLSMLRPSRPNAKPITV